MEEGKGTEIKEALIISPRIQTLLNCLLCLLNNNRDVTWKYPISNSF